MTNFFDFAISQLPDTATRGSRPPLSEIDALVQTASFTAALRLLAGSFTSLYEGSPEMTALFATRQNRLLCHALVALYFKKRSICVAEASEPFLTREDFARLALKNGLASHDVAYIFFKQALKRGLTRPVTQSDSDRVDGVPPSPLTLAMLAHWYDVHFQALDLIDEGLRASRFIERSETMLAHIHPRVAQALLSNPEVRCPGPLSIIFNWFDAGGLLMDRLIAGIDSEGPLEHGRRLTDVKTASQLAQSLSLSRTHVSRKLAAAEMIGGIGWSGRRGRSALWISQGFYEEYARTQARKLLILDDAFMEIF
ncbi:hypothetical protein DXT96_17330 [Agrobacterium sp. ICMP 6402]|uniref:hypothetical protein n=1 Tax=Agrobacterium sp. ICMP 6402 TaxID=2292443 RepID=UPI0012950EB3|nr:hypothetical protein [Agrobacterium sp. ICMP 6402]MQB11605.1 hypothetical protein [Agrobacterium sp. ICMP 6402]